MRRLRQALLIIMVGPCMAFVTVGSWFCVWPFIAFFEWAEEGRLDLREIARDSVGMMSEFIHTVRTVK